MSAFRSTFEIKDVPSKIGHEDPIFFIGSCFSSSMANFLSYRKFKVLSNPSGVIFNPLSIFKTLDDLIEAKEYGEGNLVKDQELYHSMKHHSDFSGMKAEEVVEKINKTLLEARTFLHESKYLFITLGSAWVYEYENEIVANCHKMPQKFFNKRLLQLKEILVAGKRVLDKLQEFNPQLKIVFTLSPVRHLKDGAIENNLSKSLLRLAIHQIQEENSSIGYFPSFEIMMDDLRDYRFYADDLLHPNDQALNYIWHKFKLSYIKAEAYELILRIENLQKAMAHKPRFEGSEAYQKHLRFIEQEKNALKDFF